MIWVLLALFSATLLGVYDVFKKYSLKDNTVIPVLFFSTLTSAIIFTPVVIYGTLGNPEKGSLLDFSQIPLQAHLYFFIKSMVVGSSWILAYFAMKNLPITIASPIRSSGPLWTLVGALVIFSEHLNVWQWIGLTTTIFFYYLFGLSGLKEGISFRTNKWVLYMTLSTIVGSISSLFDKFLVMHYNRLAIQAWYHIYMVPLMLALMMLVWYPNRKKYTPFQWRYTIPLIGICLTSADFIYFWALSHPGALIAIISTVRRGSVLVSFSLGAVIFKEKNIKTKAIILAGILLGIAIIIIGGKNG
jgi:bacterial/archaeal transporter family protein